MKAGHWFILFFAACIDVLQAGIGLLISILPFAAGPVGGAAAGALLCQKAGTTISGICAAVGGAAGTYFGSIIGATAAPIGIPLGMVISIVLALTMGVGLIALLALNGCLYPKYLFTGFFGEVLPGISFLPIWTGIAIASVRHNIQKEQEGSGGSTLITITNAVLPGGTPREFLNTIRAGKGPGGLAQPSLGVGTQEQRNQTPSSSRAPLLNKDIQPAQKTGDIIKKPGAGVLR